MRFSAALLTLFTAGLAWSAPKFTLDQIFDYAFPTSLSADASGNRIAWVRNEGGARNLWVAEAPAWKGRSLTAFKADDGQEIDDTSWLPDGSAIVYVRGGDFETGRDNPNPASLAAGVDQSIYIVSLSGGAARKIGEGHSPVVSPKGGRIVFIRAGQVWTSGLNADDKPEQLIHAKGGASALRWSPDGSKVAFVNGRGDHALIGVYDFGPKKLQYVDASVDRDSSPVWSPDGKQVAFVRVASTSAVGMFTPEREAETPWSIRIADVTTGEGHEIWKGDAGPGSVFHPLAERQQLLWTKDNHIVFGWEKTGWQHLYAVATTGGAAKDISGAGDYEVENVSLGRDGGSVFFSSNKAGIDTRHLFRTSANGDVKQATKGLGIEWAPVEVTGGMAMLRSDWRTPAHASVENTNGNVTDPAGTVGPNFPTQQLVEPKTVVFEAADGMPIHAQVFLPSDLNPGEKRPAMIFFHGGSRRQMLPGFHYMDYYHNAYAMNQYLASLGYIVMAVNYRSGIGYGLNFREALRYGAGGASEFNDVMGAGLYLKNRADVDGKRIGLWGGSYGGYLTAMGLSRASDMFAVGVDFHGVHNWNNAIRNFVPAYDPLKQPEAARLAFESSPLSTVSTWRSPVLLIHGDDDRNVPFNETVTLAEALRKNHVPFEQLIFPDEIHGFLTTARWKQAYAATAAFLGKYLKP